VVSGEHNAVPGAGVDAVRRLAPVEDVVSGAKESIAAVKAIHARKIGRLDNPHHPLFGCRLRTR
jgi:hypothetical protein